MQRQVEGLFTLINANPFSFVESRQKYRGHFCQRVVAMPVKTHLMADGDRWSALTYQLITAVSYHHQAIVLSLLIRLLLSSLSPYLAALSLCISVSLLAPIVATVTAIRTSIPVVSPIQKWPSCYRTESMSRNRCRSPVPISICHWIYPSVHTTSWHNTSC